jgi:hypothetical protein
VQVEETSASDTVDSLLAVLKDVEPRKQLVIVGALIETLRLLVADVPAEKRADVNIAAINAFAELSKLPVPSANFSLLRSVKDKQFDHLFAALPEETNLDIWPRLQMNAVKIFLNVLQLEPEAATPELVGALLEEEVANFCKPQPTEEATLPTAKFEINQPSTVLRAFKPKPFVYKDEDPRLMLVQYKSEMPGGGLGPSLWGMCYTDDEAGVSHVLLETGEYVTTPAHSLLLAGVTTPADVPPYLLACAYLFMPLLLTKCNKLVDTAEAFQQLQARFGEFMTPLYFHQADPQTVFSLTGVIESAKWQFGGTAPVGATAKFLVPELASSGTYVMVVAESAGIRPYVYANLVQKVAGKDKILMRIDRPREFSALGVYLFPMRDHSVALVIPPTL